ncbi:MAG TPA: hypothetical protein VGK67_32100 [Myxococcales bacterium]|jgi:hypothetical protein
MTTRTLVLAACIAAGLFAACEEMPNDLQPAEAPANAGEAPQAPLEDVPPSPPQMEGLGLWGLGLQALPQGEDAPIAAEVEDAPERVEWTLSETALRHYIDWQKHLDDSEALAEVAQSVVDSEAYPEALRERARDYTEPESPARSFARFGLSREEVEHAEQLWQELAVLRESGTALKGVPELRGRAGSSERQFLAAVQDQEERSLSEAAASLRTEYGDANVDLLLKYHASVPEYAKLLSDTVEVDASQGGAGEAEPVEPPAEATGL